ncbi:MAG: tyrosine-type recombinase/integrase [Oscillospiraceae bacterium]|nr:tyrosine-type recombinase/integrase [Oscillospiraceae bacterium]
MAAAGWADRAFVEHILAGLMPENREALRLSMDYGMRIGDVLRMPVTAAQKGVYSFKEEKTGKRRRVKLSETHCATLLSFGGRIYCFEHRTDPHKHRTRQAVYKDLKRMAKAFKVDSITPHSMRKIFTVEYFEKHGKDLGKAKRILNHSDEAVTVLYAYANIINAARQKRH